MNRKTPYNALRSVSVLIFCGASAGVALAQQAAPEQLQEITRAP
jgi:hypothetical protein